MPSWPTSRKQSAQTPHYTYSQYQNQTRPGPGPGAYPSEGQGTYAAAQARDGYRGPGGGGGGGGGGGYGQVSYGLPPPGQRPQEAPPADPSQKMRDVVKQLKQQIGEQKSRVNELKREARKSLNSGDKDSYDLYVDNMVQVRMFIRKITKAITTVNLIGTSMKTNLCNAQISGALADFLKVQGNEAKVDMDEITRNYFDNQTNLDNGLEAFLDNMRDLNDPDGTLENERARERAKIESEFNREAMVNAPERANPQMNEAQLAREKLMG